MRPGHLVLALLWSTYCFVHSALISVSVTNFFKRLLGARYAFYRLFFNAFSLAALVPLVIFSRSPQYRDPILFEWSGSWQIFQYSLILVAALLVIGGARHYSLSQFLGLQQIRRKQGPGAMTATGDIDTTGILGFVRHPWYVAVFLLLWAGDLNLATILINTILTAYLLIGTLLEERKLVLEFGDKYREYQRNVSMFVPLKWLNPGHQ